MDFSTLKDLGIAGVSVGAMATIFYFIVKKLLAEIAEARINYTSFVQDNNHTTTQLVREATATMVEVRNAIENHNTISQNQNDVLKVLLNKIQ